MLIIKSLHIIYCSKPNINGIKFLLPCPLGAFEADKISYSYRKSGERNSEGMKKGMANLLCLMYWTPSVFYSNKVIYFVKIKTSLMSQCVQGSHLNIYNGKHVLGWKLQREIKCLKCQSWKNIK